MCEQNLFVIITHIIVFFFSFAFFSLSSFGGVLCYFSFIKIPGTSGKNFFVKICSVFMFVLSISLSAYLFSLFIYSYFFLCIHRLEVNLVYGLLRDCEHAVYVCCKLKEL